MPTTTTTQTTDNPSDYETSDAPLFCGAHAATAIDDDPEPDSHGEGFAVALSEAAGPEPTLSGLWAAVDAQLLAYDATLVFGADLIETERVLARLGEALHAFGDRVRLLPDGHAFVPPGGEVAYLRAPWERSSRLAFSQVACIRLIRGEGAAR